MAWGCREPERPTALHAVAWLTLAPECKGKGNVGSKLD
jgi:hypothetical protein